MPYFQKRNTNKSRLPHSSCLWLFLLILPSVALAEDHASMPNTPAVQARAPIYTLAVQEDIRLKAAHAASVSPTGSGSAYTDHVFLLRNTSPVPLTIERFQTTDPRLTVSFTNDSKQEGAFTLSAGAQLRLTITDGTPSTHGRVSVPRIAWVFVAGQSAPAAGIELDGQHLWHPGRGASFAPPPGRTDGSISPRATSSSTGSAVNTGDTLPPLYTVTFIGPGVAPVNYGGYDVPLNSLAGLTPIGINNYGQIVADNYVKTPTVQNSSNGYDEITLWTPAKRNGSTGTFTSFVYPGVDAQGNVIDTRPHAINDNGTIVGGIASPILGGFGQDPFMWTPNSPNGGTGQFTDLAPAMTPGGGGGVAYAVNNSGQSVGYSSFYDAKAKASGFEVGYPWASALFSAGGAQSIQSSYDDSYGSVGTPTGVFPIAYGINDQGDTVGTGAVEINGSYPGGYYNNGYFSGPWQPFKNGQYLGLLPGCSAGDSTAATHINNNGMIVGTLDGAPAGAEQLPEQGVGFVWTPTSLMQPLPLAFLPSNSSYYTIEPTGINNNGSIVGVFGGGYIVGEVSEGLGILLTYNTVTGQFTPCNLLDNHKGLELSPVGINDKGQIAAAEDRGGALGGPQPLEYLISPVGRFLITDLGTLGGNASEAYGINDSEQVVGEAQTSAGLMHAFLYTPATSSAASSLADLGTLPANQTGSATNQESAAFAINPYGLVVGASYDQNQQPHAFLWDTGTMTDLHAFGGSFSAAYGIDAEGTIYGKMQDASELYHAFKCDSQTFQAVDEQAGGYFLSASLEDSVDYGDNATDLGLSNGTTTVGLGLRDDQTRVLPGGTFSYAFGSLDLVPVGGDAYSTPCVGLSDTATGDVHACQWAGYVLFVANDLGTLSSSGFSYSAANATNTFDQIVGTSYTNTGYHAFVWWHGKMTDLNTLISPTSGWTLEAATGINNHSQITGYGLINGQEHAFLLDPDINSPSTP